jgi:proteasome lid subunit RPN8/RPN11
VTITVSRDQLDAIRRHGESDYPHECCGLLIGSFEAAGLKVAVEIFPIVNAREDAAKRNRFLISPDELLRGEKHARKSRRDVVGFYHSHPDHPAVPSQFDLEHAWPVYSYIIVSVRQGRAEEMSSFELRPDRSRFDTEDLLKGP